MQRGTTGLQDTDETFDAGVGAILKTNDAVSSSCQTAASSPRKRLSIVKLAGALLLMISVQGCNKLHPTHTETVYVVARQTYLHDRVAAVSNRVAEVTNGEQLQVLDHGRRFLKVKTPNNEIGWIQELATIDSDTYDQFKKLADEHKNDPVVATAVVRDDVFLHLEPGRNTQRFTLLPANVHVQMLVRASVPKAPPGAPIKKSKSAAPASPAQPQKPQSAKEPPAPGKNEPEPEPAPEKPTVSAAGAPEAPPPMEDWWLVRDDKGNAGWLLSGRMDVDVPDSVAQYAEGQRIVGAYVLTNVHDEQADTPNHEVPEYVMLLEPYKAALPYDFDQVRVFTWSRNHHRYETAFRIRPIQGFLPLKITKLPGPTKDGALVPAFQVRIAANQNVSTDPDTGVTRPAATRTMNFVMLDTVVRRVGPDMDPIPSMHSADEKKAEKAKKAAKRKGK